SASPRRRCSSRSTLDGKRNEVRSGGEHRWGAPVPPPLRATLNLERAFMLYPSSRAAAARKKATRDAATVGFRRRQYAASEASTKRGAPGHDSRALTGDLRLCAGGRLQSRRTLSGPRSRLDW